MSEQAFNVGQKVKHKTWGIGVVVSVMFDEDAQMLDVAFNQIGIQTVYAEADGLESIRAQKSSILLLPTANRWGSVK